MLAVIPTIAVFPTYIGIRQSEVNNIIYINRAILINIFQIRITRNTQLKSQLKKFCWEEVLAFHPDRLAKISIQTPPTPLTPPPSPPPSPIPSLPTYAMLDVIRRMKERQSGAYKHRSRSVE